MYGEFTLGGVFIPTLIALMLCAFAVLSGLRMILARTGVYRLVWHPPLFDLALYVVVLGVLFMSLRTITA